MWDKTIAEQAAAWAERIQSGQATIQEQAAFVAWVDESPAHANAYHEALRRPAGAAAADARRDRAAVAKRRRTRQFAAAASVLLVGTVMLGIVFFDGETTTRAGQIRSVTLDEAIGQLICPVLRPGDVLPAR